VVRRSRSVRYSSILRSYLTYCEVREHYRSTDRLELDTDFVFPTTLLPLAVLVSKCQKSVHASNASVQGYVDWILRAGDPLAGQTYVPFVRLPSNSRDYSGVLAHLEDLSQTTQLFAGNRDAYHYLLSELIDNIYEHAQADHAYVMAQCYPKKHVIEASFMDDGMTIPKSLEEGVGARYSPETAHIAILDALSGKSAKGRGERGYGLRSSVRIANALGGEVLIVSGSGAVVARGRGRITTYALSPKNELEGTLVGIRLPDSDKRINLYKLVEE
jgi:hypothetical protein